MSSKYIKLKKNKQTQPDHLYQLLFERHIKLWYNGCDEVILHHAMSTPNGTIIASCEFYFGKDIVFANLHIEVEQDYNSIFIAYNEKLNKYMKEKINESR